MGSKPQLLENGSGAYEPDRLFQFISNAFPKVRSIKEPHGWLRDFAPPHD
jgi:hypothetical protein